MSSSHSAEAAEPAIKAAGLAGNCGPTKSLLELRAEGGAALQGRDASAAETAYQALLSIDPTDIYALVGLGSASRLRGQRDEALRRFERAAVICPSHPWPLLEISAEYVAVGAVDDAEAALRRALSLSPRHYHVLMGLGRLLRQRGERDSAWEMFRCAAASEAKQASDYIELAAEFAVLGRQEEALAALDAGVQAGADKVAVYSAKARMLRTAGQNEAALAAWKAALANNPDDSALKLEIAAEAMSVGRPADALAAYEAVVADVRVPTGKRCDAALAAYRLAQGQKNRPLSIALLERVAALDADHPQINAELAGQYRSAGRFGDAEAIYHRMLCRTPTSLHALGGLAIVRRQLGDRDGALELIRKANAIDPSNAWIRSELAISLRDAGSIDEAGAILESIEPNSSIYAWARMTLGDMARARGAKHWAVKYFRQAARTAEDPTDALGQIAAIQGALGDFDAAKSTLAQMFARDPDSYFGHMADGRLKRAISDHAGARAAFLRAAAVRPMEPQPQVEIAAEERELGDDEAAAAAIEAALRIDPRHEEALLKKGADLASRSDVDAALAVYAKLRDERPGSIWAYLSSAQLLAERGDFDAGLMLLAAARKTCAPNSNIDLREATILRQLGLQDKAFELLSTVHAHYPGELWPWVSLTSAAIDLGLFDTAEALLSAPPPLAGKERARIVNLRAQFEKTRWNLEAAIDSLGTAIALDAKDLQAVSERAKLKLLTFDLTGARLDLEAHCANGAAVAAREGRSAHPTRSLVGQLYEEFAVDSGLAGDLVALRGLSPQEQVPRLVELVRGTPDSTAPALGLMIALRRLGRFDRPPPAHGLPPRIPELITQFWNDPEPPPDVRRLMDSWTLSDPGFRIEVFDDAKAFAYLRERCDLAVARAFVRANEPAQRADIFRLARLWREGGFYVDADDRARGSLAATVPRDVEFFAYQEDLGSIANNVMGATPGHPVIETALRDAVAAIARDDRDLVWLSTGPGLLTRSLARWFAAEPSVVDERIGAVAILTLAEMRRVATMYCHAAYKTTSRAWLSAAFKRHDRKQ